MFSRELSPTRSPAAVRAQLWTGGARVLVLAMDLGPAGEHKAASRALLRAVASGLSEDVACEHRAGDLIAPDAVPAAAAIAWPLSRVVIKTMPFLGALQKF